MYFFSNPSTPIDDFFWIKTRNDLEQNVLTRFFNFSFKNNVRKDDFFGKISKTPILNCHKEPKYKLKFEIQHKILNIAIWLYYLFEISFDNKIFHAFLDTTKSWLQSNLYTTIFLISTASRDFSLDCRKCDEI